MILFCYTEDISNIHSHRYKNAIYEHQIKLCKYQLTFCENSTIFCSIVLGIAGYMILVINRRSPGSKGSM